MKKLVEDTGAFPYYCFEQDDNMEMFRHNAWAFSNPIQAIQAAEDLVKDDRHAIVVKVLACSVVEE